MLTEECTLINRANARKSTGPKTNEGTGQAIRLPEKERAAYKEFTATMFADYKPVGAVEEQFFYMVSDTYWRLNHVRALEFKLLSLKLDKHQDGLNVKHEEALSAQLASLSLYEQRLNQTLHTNLDKLEALQKTR